MAQLKELIVNGPSALLGDVNITGIPTAPTAVVGTNSTQIATTAFIKNTIDSLNLGNARIYYGVCGTAAATAQKEVTCEAYTTTGDPIAGDIIYVAFNVTNSAAVANLTLKVNQSTAKGIRYQRTPQVSTLPSAEYLSTSNVYRFVYNGTYWVTVLDTNTDSVLRVYTQTSGYSGDYPILVGSTLASALMGKSNNSTTGVYGIIYKQKAPTLNPATGLLKIPGSLTVGTSGDTNTTLQVYGTTSLNGNLCPSTSGIYDLGSNSLQWKDIYGNLIGNAKTASAVPWSGITNKPITFTPPIASSNILGGIKEGNGIDIDSSGVASVNLSELGLSSAMHFKGITTTTMSDGLTTAAVTINNTSYTPSNGDVVLYSDSEFIWTGSSWESLGRDSSFKITQTAVTDVAATDEEATAFISSITQNSNGVISATKKKLPNVVTYTQNNNVSVPGAGVGATTTKTVYKYNQTTIFTPNGLIIGGTAQNAGLATRGICGISIPNNTGAATKDHLYINYDGNNTYRSDRQLILQADSVGTYYGNNVYQYAAVRGDAMKAWVEAKGYSTTDEKVKQNIETSNVNYPILFSYSASPTSGTNEYVKYTDKITINPYNGCISPSASSLYDLGTNSYWWRDVYGEYFSGNAETATAANLTTTVNAIAYYNDTTGTFASKSSADGALYATSAGGELQWGTLPVGQGGTGNNIALTQYRPIFASTTSQMAACTNIYMNNTSLAINVPNNSPTITSGYNFEVNGKSKFTDIVNIANVSTSASNALSSSQLIIYGSQDIMGLEINKEAGETGEHSSWQIINDNTGATFNTNVLKIRTNNANNGTYNTDVISFNYNKILAYQNINLEENKQISRTATGSYYWYDGRNKALIYSPFKENYYNPAISIKTKNGSWNVAANTGNTYLDKLLFTYYPDSENNNSSYAPPNHILFESNRISLVKTGYDTSIGYRIKNQANDVSFELTSGNSSYVALRDNSTNNVALWTDLTDKVATRLDFQAKGYLPGWTYKNGSSITVSGTNSIYLLKYSDQTLALREGIYQITVSCVGRTSKPSGSSTYSMVYWSGIVPWVSSSHTFGYTNAKIIGSNQYVTFTTANLQLWYYFNNGNLGSTLSLIPTADHSNCTTTFDENRIQITMSYIAPFITS